MTNQKPSYQIIQFAIYKSHMTLFIAYYKLIIIIQVTAGTMMLHGRKCLRYSWIYKCNIPPKQAM